MMNIPFFQKIATYTFVVIFFLTTALHLHAQVRQQSQIVIDSLQKALNNPDLSEDEFFATCERLFIDYEHDDNEKSLEYAWKGIRLAEKNKNYYQLAIYYYSAGGIHCYFSQLDSALYYFEQSLLMHTQAVNKGEGKKGKLDLLLIDLYMGFAEINYYNGEYDLALNNFFKALELAEKINNPEKTAKACFNVAEAYSAMYNYQQTETYLLKADQIYRTINDSVGIADMYLRLSRVYILTEKVPKGLEYAEEAYRIVSAMPDAPFEILYSSVSRLCDVWLMVPDYGKALEYSLKVVELAGQINKPRRLSSALYQLSLCYLLLKRYEEADETAFLSLAADSTDLYYRTNNYGIILTANIWLKNSAKAAQYEKMSRLSIHNLAMENFQASISEMEVKYQIEKKEFQIEALKGEKRLMLWLSVAGGGLLLLGLVALFLIWRWTVQKRRLAEQQHAIVQAHIVQLEQEKQLIATQAVLDGETKERSRLAHDLHDGLGSMLTGVKLNLELLKGKTYLGAEIDYFNKAMLILDHSMVEMRRVAHHLMPDTLDRYGLKAALSGFLNDIPSVEFAWYGNDDRLNDQKKEVMIYRIVHELVNNALKHSGATKICVNVMREPDYIAFTVFDNGCGFDALSESKGIGLSNIRERVAACNGGRIEINSTLGKGTEINVELRVKN